MARSSCSTAANLERFNANGSIDTSFGSNGVVTIPPPSTYPPVWPLTGLVIQANGEIVVSGETDDPAEHPAFILTRLNTNGSLDTSFGTNGTATLQVLNTQPWKWSSLALQADGKLVVAGDTGTVAPVSTGKWPASTPTARWTLPSTARGRFRAP